MADCGKGWAARCAASKGRKCRCRCGGTYHGQLRNQITMDLTTSRQARFTVVSVNADAMIIRDVGPHDAHLSVTNDAEGVVARLAPELNGRRLFYYDTEGQLDELVVADGKFKCFAPGGPPLTEE